MSGTSLQPRRACPLKSPTWVRATRPSQIERERDRDLRNKSPRDFADEGDIPAIQKVAGWAESKDPALPHRLRLAFVLDARATSTTSAPMTARSGGDDDGRDARTDRCDVPPRRRDDDLWAGADPTAHAGVTSLRRVLPAGRRRCDPPARRLEIPFAGGVLPGYLRLPRDVERPPCVIVTGGANSVKEENHAITGYLLARGLATFAFDGPGQGEYFVETGEAPARRILCGQPSRPCSTPSPRELTSTSGGSRSSARRRAVCSSSVPPSPTRACGRSSHIRAVTTRGPV